MTSHETPESRLAELLRARKEARSGTTHDASTTRFGALAAQPQQVAVPPRKRTVPDGSHPRTEHRIKRLGGERRGRRATASTRRRSLA